jgi:hypothetical protein
MKGFRASRWESGVEGVEVFEALSYLQHGRELQAPEAASNTLIFSGTNSTSEATTIYSSRDMGYFLLFDFAIKKGS